MLRLQVLVDALNRQAGFTNRYRLVLSLTRNRGEARKVRLVKAVGPLDANETTWLTPTEMASYLDGFMAGFATHVRRAHRAQYGVHS